MVTLLPGMRHAEVLRMKAILRSQGYTITNITDLYDDATAAEVSVFQGQHLDSSGQYLVSDQKVGAKTWWALENPTGSKQKNHLKLKVLPAGLSAQRQKLLSVAAAQHAQGIKEIPDGANSGDGVTKFIEGFGAAPWCALAVSWIFKEATGAYLMGKRWALVRAMWAAAKEAGIAHLKSEGPPIPGDIVVFLYRNRSGQLNGTGHTGIVAAVSEDGAQFNTFAGNEGNRFKLGLRRMSETDLVGFIRPFGNDSSGFARGLITNISVAGDTTR